MVGIKQGASLWCFINLPFSGGCEVATSRKRETCIRPNSPPLPAKPESRYRNRADQALCAVHAGVVRTVVNRTQAVTRNPGQNGLHVFRQDLVAAFEQRPGASAIEQRERGTGRQAGDVD